MADKQITLAIVLENTEAVTGLRNIKEGIKLVNDELTKTKEGTAEYDKLSASAGILKDKINDLNDSLKLTQGSTFERFKNSLQTIREGFTNLDPGKLSTGIKGVTQAFGGLGKAIIATGIGALVIGVIKLIQNFEELKKAGGLVGAVFTTIGDTIGFIIDSIKDLSDTIGFTNFALQELKEAEEEFGQQLRETNQQIGAERRKQLVLTGKLSEEEAARQNAKEKFVTDFLKIQTEARKKLAEDLTDAQREAVEKQRQADLKLLQDKYVSEVLAINKGEKDKADAKAKADADANKKAEEEQKKAEEKRLNNLNKFNQDIAAVEAKGLNEFQAIEQKAFEESRKLEDDFNKLTAKEQEENRGRYQDAITEIELRATKEREDLKAKIVAEKDEKAKAEAERIAKEKAQAEKDAKDAAEKEINGGLTAIEAEFIKLQTQGQLTTDEEIRLTQEKYAKLIELAKLKGESIAALEQEEANVIGQIKDASRARQIAQASALGNALISIATSLTEFGKKSEKQKIKDQRNVALAGIALSTGLGIAQAVSDGMKVGVTPIEKGIAIASGIALVFANIAKARKVVKDADAAIAKLGEAPAPAPDLSAGGSGAVGGGGATGSAPQVPSFNLFGTGVNANNLGGSNMPQMIQAYVVESDITGVQRRVERFRTASEL